MDDRLRYPGLISYNPYRTGLLASVNDVYVSGTSSHLSVKDRQVAELRQAVPDCRCKNSTDSLWELAVVTHEGSRVHLNFAVPPNYPQEPPRVSVVEFRGVDHYWVDKSDGTMTVHCLDGWTGGSKSPSLAEVVKQAYVAITGRDYVPPAESSAAGAAAPGSGRPHAHGDGMGQEPPGSNAPGAAALHAKLESLSTTELQQLLTEENAFATLVRAELAGTPEARRLEALHEKQVAMARDNVALLSEYENTDQQILISKQGELPPAQTYYNELMARQTAIISKLDSSSLLADLKADVERADERAKVIEQEFLSSVDVTEQRLGAFVSSSIHQRTEQYALEIKLQAASSLAL